MLSQLVYVIFANVILFFAQLWQIEAIGRGISNAWCDCNVHLNYFNIDFEQHGSSDHFWFLHVAILLWIPMRKLYCLRRNELLGGEAMKEEEEGGD